MNDAAKASDERTSAKAKVSPTQGPPTRWYVTVLLVLATLFSFLAIFAVWANRQALNTDNWTNTSSRLLEDKTIRDQVALYMVDQLYENVDVAGELEQLAPNDLKGLAGPASGLLRQGADRVAQRALETAQFQSAWEKANRLAHEQLLSVLRGGNDAVSTQGGNVVLDLRVLIENVATQIGLSKKLVSRIPADAGELVILKSDQLKAAQDIADLIESLAVVLTILALALFALAIFLAGGYRRRTLRTVGWCLVIAGVLALLARSLAGGVVVNALATTEAVEPAARNVWEIATTLLHDIAWSVIVSGFLVVIAAWVAGPTTIAVKMRRAIAPYLRDQLVLSYVVAGVILVLLVAWGPTTGFRNPVMILLYAVLLAIGVDLLRRETMREFPDEQLATAIGSFSEAADRIREAVSRGGSKVGNAVSGIGRGRGSEDRLVQLERLGRLKESGVLSDAEFEREKEKLLGGGD